jgi:imidazole glycerol-phosphate synthase subunit HisH
MFVIVDYGVGNLTSIQNTAVISGNIEVVAKASRLLLPGMGHFDNCMIKFNDSGLREVVEQKVFQERVPVLGICVGLQMFMASSEEGDEQGFGWIKGKTIKFRQSQMDGSFKVPNMGWLDVQSTRSSKLWECLDDARFYFAHSYHVETIADSDILLSADYGYRFTAGIERDNILGVQFHPEKSHRFGMRLLKNFAENY